MATMLNIQRAMQARQQEALRRNQARQRLLENAGLGRSPNAVGGYFPDRGPSNGLAMNPLPLRPGEFHQTYGVAPTEADVTQFMGQAGGYPNQPMTAPQAPGQPYTPPGQQWAQGGQFGQGAGYGAPGGSQDLLSGLFWQLQGDMQAANQANEQRYTEGKGELTGLRDRNQANWVGWGDAAKADINDDLHAALSRNRAELASRGLANSTIQPAFDLKRSQYATREQQRIGEQQRAHAVESDTRDTGALTNWIYNREDTAVDPSQLIGLAEKLGANGLGRQAGPGGMTPADHIAAARSRLAGNGGNRRLLQRYPDARPRGIQWDGTINWVNGNPVQFANNYLQPYPVGFQHGSNRWPTPRPFPT